MSIEDEEDAQAEVHRLIRLVLEKMQNGQPQEEIERSLMYHEGLSQEEASSLYEAAFSLVISYPEKHVPEGPSPAWLLVREPMLFIVGVAANCALCWVASIILGAFASLGDVGNFLANTIGGEIAGIGISFLMVGFGTELRSIGWMIGSIVGYFLYLGMIFSG